MGESVEHGGVAPVIMEMRFMDERHEGLENEPTTKPSMTPTIHSEG